MIQRIQSLFLFGIVALLTISLFLPVWTNEEPGTAIEVNAFAISKKADQTNKIPDHVAEAISQEESAWYIAFTMLVAASLAGFTILKYNNRTLQILLCNINTLVISALIGTYFIAIPKAKTMMAVSSDGHYGFAYFTPIACLLLVQAAAFYIKKDDKLIKSVDRIR